jgi:hypothetical protein
MRPHVALERILLLEASGTRRSNLLRTLRSLGADRYDLHLPETHYLSQLMKPHEKLLGILYGRYKHDNGQPVGRGLLAATNERLLFVDRKPFYTHFDELIYAVVSGVTYTHIGLSTTVTVSTRMGDISFRTFNRTATRCFVAAVERMLFEQQRKGVYDNNYR